MNESVDTSVLDVLIEAVFIDDRSEVALWFGPVSLLDDTSIHVDDVEGSVWSGDHVYRAEVRVSGADEFAFLVGVAELGDAVVYFYFRSADEPSYGFCEEEVAT